MMDFKAMFSQLYWLLTAGSADTDVPRLFGAFLEPVWLFDEQNVRYIGGIQADVVDENNVERENPADLGTQLMYTTINSLGGDAAGWESVAREATLGEADDPDNTPVWRFELVRHAEHGYGVICVEFFDGDEPTSRIRSIHVFEGTPRGYTAAREEFVGSMVMAKIRAWNAAHRGCQIPREDTARQQMAA